MRVLFVMPPVGAWSTYGLHRAPNQFYAQLAAYIRKTKTAEVEVLDARASDLSYEAMIAEVKKRASEVVILGDILHSTGGAAIIWHFNQAARLIKEALPNVKIIVGGIWYSALYEQTLKSNPAIDYVMVGEAELTLDEILKVLNEDKKDLHNIAGLASRQNGKLVIGPHRELIQNIDDLPLPAYDLFPMDRYVGHSYWDHFCELYTSRGCPGGCSFCYEWSQYDPRFPRDFISWRAHSSERILDEMELLTKKFGVKTVVFQDDAFNVDTKMVEDFCNGLIKRNIKLNWVILGRADDWIKQIPIYPLMKKSGMFMGLVGVEVESDEELARLGKGITTGQIKQTIDELRKNDIATVGTFMMGFEDDTEEKIKKRFEFANWADPDIFALQFVTPMPGSPLWNKLVKAGKIVLGKIDLKKWDFHHPVIATKYMSQDDLGRMGAWCTREFFSKPGRIGRIMEGAYSDLAKVCVKSFMENISHFEDAATKGDTYV